MGVKLYKPAPRFTLPKSGGGTISLDDYYGHFLVLYFYPRDGSVSCTRQAREFTEAVPQFEEFKAKILGISCDAVEAHDAFIAEHKFGITLASDLEGVVCRNYNVWSSRVSYGRTVYGIERSTFLIDPTGCTLQVWRRIKVPGHIRDIMRVLKTCC